MENGPLVCLLYIPRFAFGDGAEVRSRFGYCVYCGEHLRGGKNQIRNPFRPTFGASGTHRRRV